MNHLIIFFNKIGSKEFKNSSELFCFELILKITTFLVF